MRGVCRKFQKCLCKGVIAKLAPSFTLRAVHMTLLIIATVARQDTVNIVEHSARCELRFQLVFLSDSSLFTCTPCTFRMKCSKEYTQGTVEAIVVSIKLYNRNV
jgi:hypothetical protein